MFVKNTRILNDFVSIFWTLVREGICRDQRGANLTLQTLLHNTIPFSHSWHSLEGSVAPKLLHSRWLPLWIVILCYLWGHMKMVLPCEVVQYIVIFVGGVLTALHIRLNYRSLHIYIYFLFMCGYLLFYILFIIYYALSAGLCIPIIYHWIFCSVLLF